MGPPPRDRLGASLSTFRVILLGLFAGLLVAATIATTALYYGSDPAGSDIYYSWGEGARILRGENPYSRILGSDMLHNDKYPTYFPLFYLLSAATQGMGFREYPEWIGLWRIVFAFFDVGIIAILFWLPYRRGLPLLAAFAGAFWALNRWTLFELRIAQLDFIPIFFLLLSLALFEKRQRLSLLLFGVSISAKQIGIFLAPLYLIWAWRSAPEASRRRATIVAGATLAVIPLLLSLPFLVADAEGYLRSIFFSATRLPSSHFEAFSIDAELGLVGLWAKLPMLALMALVYGLALFGQVGRFTAALLVLSVFVDFNSVLYTHYLCWVVPLLPLAVSEYARPSPPVPAPAAA